LNRLSGYTMIELIITVMVGSLLLSIAIPTFFWVTNSNRIAAEINGLLGDMQFGRAEAVKEGQPVTVCVSADGATCGGVSTWQSGWIVFSDVNGNAVVDPGDTILRIQKPFTGTDTFVATPALSAVTFNRDGYANGVAAGTLIELHDQTNNHNWTRCLAINMVGMMASQTYNTNTNGLICQ
jgi:type IV fimbrial biogenesis protein FimT